MMQDKHLNKPEQYALVYDKGRAWVDNLVVMKALPNQLTVSRYGLSVSRRLGKAVVRNRVKRRLREILRLLKIEPGWDIVFIARSDAAGASFESLGKSVKKLLSRAKLLTREYEEARLNTN